MLKISYRFYEDINEMSRWDLGYRDNSYQMVISIERKWLSRDESDTGEIKQGDRISGKAGLSVEQYNFSKNRA